MVKWIFAHNLKKRFWRDVFDRSNYGASFSNQKSTHWWINFSFKIHIADLFQSTFGQAWLDQQLLPAILAICYFRALWTCQAPNKNFMIKLQLLWVSFYIQKANFLPQILFEISKSKKLWNLTGLECFQLQLTAMLFL